MATLLQFMLSKEMRKEEKPQWENPPLNMDSKTKFGNIVITHASQHDQKSPAVI